MSANLQKEEHCDFHTCFAWIWLKKNTLKRPLVTFSFLHHSSRLSECKTLHRLVALAPRRPFFWQAMILTMNCVHQHSAVESVALLAGCLPHPRPIWHYGGKKKHQMSFSLRHWLEFVKLLEHKLMFHRWTWVDSYETPPCPHRGWCCTH